MRWVSKGLNSTEGSSVLEPSVLELCDANGSWAEFPRMGDRVARGEKKKERETFRSSRASGSGSQCDVLPSRR